MAGNSVGREDYAKSFVKRGTYVFTALIAASIVGFLMRIFLARTLGAAEYGVFFTGFTILSALAQFRDPGIGTAIIKYMPDFIVKKKHGDLKSSITFYMLVQVGFSAIVGLVCIVFSDQILRIVVGSTEAAIVLKILGGWFIFEAFYYSFKTIFQGLQDMVPLSVLIFLEIFFPFIFALLLIGILGLGATGIALSYSAGLGMVAVVGFAFFYRKHDSVLKAKANMSKELIKKLLAFAAPSIIAAGASIIIGYMNTLMLARYNSYEQVGYYQVAQPAANLLLYLTAALGTVLYPMVSELWAKKDTEMIGQAMSTLLKFSFIFIVPMALVVMAYPNVIISLIFGENFLPASFALQILAAGAIVQTLSIIPNRMILGVGRPATITLIMWVTAAFTFVFNIFLIPPYAAAGAAASALIATLAGLFLSLYLARGYVSFSIPYSPIVKTLVGGGLTLLVVTVLKLVLDLPVLAEAIIVIVLSLLFYLVWILLTRTLTAGDLVLLERTMPIPKRIINFAKKFVKKTLDSIPV